MLRFGHSFEDSGWYMDYIDLSSNCDVAIKITSSFHGKVGEINPGYPICSLLSNKIKL